MKTFAAHFKTEDGVLLSAMETTGFLVSNDEVHQIQNLTLEAHITNRHDPLRFIARATVDCYKSTVNTNDPGKPACVMPGMFSTSTAAFAFMAEKRMKQAMEFNAKAVQAAGGAS